MGKTCHFSCVYTVLKASNEVLGVGECAWTDKNHYIIEIKLAIAVTIVLFDNHVAVRLTYHHFVVTKIVD